MQLDGHATNQDINTLIDDLCDSDDTSYPVQRKVLNINTALEELVGMIINADGTWQFDDTNHTDAPRSKGDLVEGQEYYTFASDYLQIEAVDVLDLNNLYKRLIPYDPQDHENISPDDYYGVDASGNPLTGFPEVYDIKGDSIRLYPAPTAVSCTLTSGIRVSFKRTVDLFTTSDTSQEPGIPSTHHVMLAYMAAIPYCMKYHQDRVGMYEKKVVEMKKTLLEHYANREKGRRAIITPKRRPYR